MKPLSSLALLAVLSTTAWSQVSVAPGESQEARRFESDKRGLWTATAIEYSFDDNVHRLSTEDMDLFRVSDRNSPLASQRRFSRMRSLTDHYFRYGGGLYLQGRPLNPDWSQRVGVDLDFKQYSRNTLKSHPAIRFFLRNYFDEWHHVEAHFKLEPDQFSGNYLGKHRSTEYFPGNFQTLAGGLSWNGRFAALGGFDAGLFWEYAEERYREDELFYLSTVIHREGGRIGRRWAPRLYTQVRYEYVEEGARRVAFSDRSHKTHTWGLLISGGPVLDKLRLDLEYSGSFRRYTSLLGETFNPTHAGRRDHIDEISLQGVYALEPRLEIYVRALWRDQRSNLPARASNEPLRYNQRVYSLGARSRWDLPVQKASRDPSRRPDMERTGFWTKAGIAFWYDDNVNNLSPEDMSTRNTASIDDNGPVQARFNGIRSIGDAVYRFSTGLYEQSQFFGEDFATRLGVDLDYFKFQQNTIKDHPVARPFVRQYLGDQHYFELYNTVAINRFDRNYFGKTETARRFPGNYSDRTIGAVWDGRMPLLGGLDMGLEYEYAWLRYYEPQLIYRNTKGRRYGTRVGRRWMPWLYTRGRYRFEQLWAARSDAHDRSAEEHRWGLDVEIIPWKWPKTRVDMSYAGGFKHFLSNRPTATDPFHAGRRDFFDEMTLRGIYTPNIHWEFWANYQRTDHRTNLPKNDSDEYLRYAKNVFGMGFSTRWDLEFLNLAINE